MSFCLMLVIICCFNLIISLQWIVDHRFFRCITRFFLYSKLTGHLMTATRAKVIVFLIKNQC